MAVSGLQKPVVYVSIDLAMGVADAYTKVT